MRVNEIFYSIQGEGWYSGTPAVFIRFSGCNLRCAFCDTDHSRYTNLTEEDIVDVATSYPSRHVVITGGEPMLQISKKLLTLLRNEGFFVQIETNGCVPDTEGVSELVDWVTCSPKKKDILLSRVDELKVVMGGSSELTPLMFEDYVSSHTCMASLQPCDTGDSKTNMRITCEVTDYVKEHPHWHLSLQTHKMAGFR